MSTEQYDQATRARALQSLGVLPKDFDDIQRSPHPRALELLKELKTRARSTYGKLCLELHPDKTGGDEEKAARFKEITYVYAWLKNLEVRPTPLPIHMPMPIRMVINGTTVIAINFNFRP